MKLGFPRRVFQCFLTCIGCSLRPNAYRSIDLEHRITLNSKEEAVGRASGLVGMGLEQTRTAPSILPNQLPKKPYGLA